MAFMASGVATVGLSALAAFVAPGFLLAAALMLLAHLAAWRALKARR